MSRSIGIARSALDNYVSGKRAIPVPIAYEICATLDIAPHLVVMRAEERLAAESAQPESNVTALRPRMDVPTLTEDEELGAVARPAEKEPTEEQ